MKHIFSLLVFVIVAYAVVPGLVLAGSGFYVSSEIGANFASGIDTTGFSNDRATVCDEFINPDFRKVPPTVANCTGPGRGVGDDWKNDFDGATGILTGAAVGYSFSETYSDRPWGGLRVELEYFYRESKYDEASDIHGALGESRNILEQELVAATERIDGITSHNLFGNLFFDWNNASRFTPYLGVGAGVGFTDIGYGLLWARHSDPERVSAGEGRPNVTEIRDNLAGKATVVQATLSDTLFGFQVLFGVDYALTEATSLGLKGRWVNFDSFRDDDIVPNLLRSHVPNLRRDGSEPVSGGIKTDDVEFFGVSVNVKYRF